MKKSKLNYNSIKELEKVANVVNESALALADKNRTIVDSVIPDAVGSALGAGVGGTVTFTMLYGLGNVGLSAAGITSALNAAAFGMGMVPGLFVIAAPIVAFSFLGGKVFKSINHKKLVQERSNLYKVALEKHQALIIELKRQVNLSNERIKYLEGLNILLEQAIKELKEDIENDW